jgi:hypothetical protein
MKRLLVLFFISFLFNSCSVGSDETREFVNLPVQSAVMPTAMTVDEISQITIKYTRPTDCYIFNGFNLNNDAFTCFVAIEAVKLKQSNCMPDSDNLFEVTFLYKPTVTGIYTFKFWAGKDTNGNDTFISYEIEAL